MQHFKPSDPRWLEPIQDDIWLQQIIEEFHIHPVVAQTLVSRGFRTLKDIHSFLYASLRDLYDPYLFVDMTRAVDRLVVARKKAEKVVIYGDTDVDGMTAAALLVDYLTTIGVQAFPFLPSRDSRHNEMREGLDYAKSIGSRLVITVDCGITAAAEIAQFTTEGVDVIVTDHHEPTHKIPHCLATLNPKLLDGAYPNRDLTGVGVAFKLIHALTIYLVKTKKIPPKKVNLESYLDLVALGTIADMAPLLGENRIFARFGLKRLAQTRRLGLLKLFEVCDVDPGKGITALDIASKVAPRLNSIGRIDEGRKGVQLLLAADWEQAAHLAQELDQQNTERQKIERQMSEHLEELIANDPSSVEGPMIVLSSDAWHPGIVPILSARLAKQYSRPVCLIAVENSVGKGSLRTIPQFPLLPMLHESSDLLIDYGGHDFAAGLTIHAGDVSAFTQAAKRYAEHHLHDLELAAQLQIDAAVSLSDLNFELLDALSLFEPYGQDNPPPVFSSQVKQSWPPKVVSGNHLKVYLEEEGRMLEGIGFGMADMKASLRRKTIEIKAAFTPQINRFLNKTSIQLLIRSLQVVGVKKTSTPKGNKD